MIHPELYLNLNYEQKINVAVIIVTIAIICVIVTKIKNKAKITNRKQVTRPTIQFDLYSFLMQDFNEEFIGKRKAYKNEIKRL